MIVGTISAAIMEIVIARAHDKSSYSFWLVFSNPAKAPNL
jgi:hypothetical protein